VIGSYGDPGTEPGLEIYGRAAARMPGYTRPADDTAARTSEIDAYAYQETEMYSWTREVEYYTPNAPTDRAKLDGILAALALRARGARHPDRDGTRQGDAHLALVEVVVRLGRAEATAWLCERLIVAEPAAGAAAIALGRSPDPAARDARVAALAALDPDFVIATLDGLRLRGDRSSCASLAALARHGDAEVRHVWVRASAALGCLDATALARPRGVGPRSRRPQARRRAGP
jgi:hypothetical protein